LPLEITQIDSFTDRPFSGNPAAVCVVDRSVNEQWMQQVAAEMNLSETAFLAPPVRPDDEWALRWFTPTMEVDLCGHATLAAAHHLFSELGVDRPVLRFGTRSGTLSARHTDDGWIELDFPADPTLPLDPPSGLLDALGVSDGVVSVASGKVNVVIELVNADIVRNIRPDFGALSRVDAAAVVVTAAGEGNYDMVSRFFAPLAGIDEDPVTGAAHCTLGPFWAAKLGRPDLLAYQASARGGVVRVGVRGDRVRLAGQAVSVFTAKLSATADAPTEGSPAVS
jgi:PhzF family phenazine biosynthesis protein